MYRKDYILKVIEQLANSLAILKSVVKKKDPDAAQDVFATEVERFVQMPYAQFVVDNTENWFETLFLQYGQKNEVFENFANLLLEGAEISFDSHRITEGFLLVIKCQKLYNYLIESDNSYSLVRENNLERLAILISKFSN